ncbi:MAG TPA: TIM barrel protein [Acidobacteriaceae bacterium]|nr:TIM barrel protein [Acidobacteriaceae bacterium]
MTPISRRRMLRGALAGAALVSGSQLAWPDSAAPIQRKNRIHQSVCRWCYRKISLDDLCAYSAHIGLKGVDLLPPEQYEIPRRYGLICTMGEAGGGVIAHGLNRIENHAEIEAGFRRNIPLAAKAGVPNVITFSGNRAGLSDEEGARNTILGLNRVKKIAEDNGVTICMELLNSKVNHKDYMCDHTAWGVEVVQQVNSPNVKLLYDIYHMQIMEGDLIMTIQANIQWLGHFHTGGVPGRYELNDQQEVQWDGVMRGILAANFQGYVAHEFVPAGDPYAGLLQATNLCDV